MNIIGLVSTAAGLATSLGAGAVVGNIIKATTPDDLDKKKQILVMIGGAALSAVAANETSRYVEKRISNILVAITAAGGAVKGVKAAVKQAWVTGSEASKDVAEATGDALDEIGEKMDDPDTDAQRAS